MKRATVNYNLFIWIIFYIIMLQPEGLTLNQSVNQLFTLAKLGICALTCVLYFYHNRISLPIIVLILYEACFVCSTLLYGTETKFVSKNAIYIIGFCMATDMGMRACQKEVVRGFFYVTASFVLINFATVILYPEGWWVSNETQPHWFLGQKNMIIMLMIPAMISGLVDLAERGKKISVAFLLVFICSLVSIFITKSSTSIVIMVIFTLFYLLYLCNVNYVQIFNVKNYIIAIFVSNFFVLFSSQITVLRWFITVVLKKELHFTGRTTIWEHAFGWIAKSPIWGWGYENNAVITDKLGGNPAFVSCHNYFLNIFYKQGVIGFALILMLYILLIKSLKQKEGFAFTQLVGFGVFLLLFCGIFEALGWTEPVMWLVFVGVFYEIPQYMKEGTT